MNHFQMGGLWHCFNQLSTIPRVNPRLLPGQRRAPAAAPQLPQRRGAGRAGAGVRVAAAQQRLESDGQE